MTAKPAILFLCIGNSIRSQIAEGFMKYYAGERIDCFSAGVAPTRVHPLAIQVMREKGIDISGQTSKSLADISIGKITMVATLCAEADEICPVFARPVPVYRWHFQNPDTIYASEEARLNVFRQVRDGIEQKVKTLIQSL